MYVFLKAFSLFPVYFTSLLFYVTDNSGYDTDHSGQVRSGDFSLERSQFNFFFRKTAVMTSCLNSFTNTEIMSQTKPKKLSRPKLFQFYYFIFKLLEFIDLHIDKIVK